jgi:hypothetical protein
MVVGINTFNLVSVVVSGWHTGIFISLPCPPVLGDRVAITVFEMICASGYSPSGHLIVLFRNIN